ncbi:MAG TPA: hypothetical protein EYG80_03960 [Flavobacteriaceae bacterium]|nr:hypothetical protein [Flavobacteriaceae bacterium]
MKKHIIYFLGLGLLGVFLINYMLPMPYPTYERVFYGFGLSYLSILLGAFSVWFSMPYESITFKIIVTMIGLLCIFIWKYMLRKKLSFRITLIPMICWLFMGWVFIFASISASC